MKPPKRLFRTRPEAPVVEKPAGLPRSERDKPTVKHNMMIPGKGLGQGRYRV